MLKILYMMKVKRWSASVILHECCNATGQEKYTKEKYTKEIWTPAMCLNFHRFFLNLRFEYYKFRNFLLQSNHHLTKKNLLFFTKILFDVQ